MTGRKLAYATILAIVTAFRLFSQDTALRTESGHVSFKSNAPLEIIEAQSDQLRGVIDTSKNTFAFTIDMTTFDGFNSSLQKTHFNENYLESGNFPNAIFLGKIIEKINWQAIGVQTIRAKGELEIHGIRQERIIKSEIDITANGMTIKSDFSVMLNDHNISIPKIVSQKIAEKIFVSVSASFAILSEP